MVTHFAYFAYMAKYFMSPFICIYGCFMRPFIATALSSEAYSRLSVLISAGKLQQCQIFLHY